MILKINSLLNNLNTSLNSLYSSSGMIFSIEYRARTRRDPGSIPFKGMWELSRNHSSVACPFCNRLNWQRINTSTEKHQLITVSKDDTVISPTDFPIDFLYSVKCFK